MAESLLAPQPHYPYKGLPTYSHPSTPGVPFWIELPPEAKDPDLLQKVQDKVNQTEAKIEHGTNGSFVLKMEASLGEWRAKFGGQISSEPTIEAIPFPYEETQLPQVVQEGPVSRPMTLHVVVKTDPPGCLDLEEPMIRKIHKDKTTRRCWVDVRDVISSTAPEHYNENNENNEKGERLLDSIGGQPRGYLEEKFIQFDGIRLDGYGTKDTVVWSAKSQGKYPGFLYEELKEGEDTEHFVAITIDGVTHKALRYSVDVDMTLRADTREIQPDEPRLPSNGALSDARSATGAYPNTSNRGFRQNTPKEDDQGRTPVTAGSTTAIATPDTEGPDDSWKDFTNFTPGPGSGASSVTAGNSPCTLGRNDTGSPDTDIE